MSDIGNKEIFSANLNKLIETSGKSRNEICKDLNIAYSTFSEWVNGKKYPRIDKIELLADYFGVKKSNLIEENNTSPVSVLLLEAIKEKGLSYEELELQTGISKDELRLFVTGQTKTIPAFVIEKIAQITGAAKLKEVAFEVDIDTMLKSIGKEDNKIIDYLECHFSKDDEINIAFEIISNLSKLNYFALTELKKTIELYLLSDKYKR